MYERSYGYKYGEAGSGHAPDIAKLMRADIKQAVAEGLLPKGPQYSVRSETYSGGQSIDITVKGWPGVWVDCDGTVPGSRRVWPDGSSVTTACPNVWCKARNDSPHATAHLVLTEEGQAAKMTLERIHGAYNHDGSEVQVDYFDVRYYGGVSFEDAESAAWREKEKAAKAARRAELDAAEDVRRLRVYGRNGPTTHLAAVVEKDGRKALRLLCGAQLWRSSLWDTAADDVVLSCSRCAKKEGKR